MDAPIFEPHTYYPILLCLNSLQSPPLRANRGAILKTSSHLTSKHVDVAPIAAQSPAFLHAGFTHPAPTTYPDVRFISAAEALNAPISVFFFFFFFPAERARQRRLRLRLSRSEGWRQCGLRGSRSRTGSPLHRWLIWTSQNGGPPRNGV